MGGEAVPLVSKLDRLAATLRHLGPIVVAYSGGVDSTFLLAVACSVAPDTTRAVLGVSPSLSSEGHRIARNAAREIGAPLVEVETREVEDPAYLANAPDRCFHCKDTLFTRLGLLVEESRARWGSAIILDGTNRDDLGDTRPGRAAAERHGVRSPLAEQGWTKAEIREVSRAMGLSTWDRPASPCLSSRVPHGTRISEEILRRIERAEAALHELGFRTVRVRHHDSLARIEVPAGEIPDLLRKARPVVAALTAAGYRHVTVDLDGYRTGGADRPALAAFDSRARAHAELISGGDPHGDFEV